MNEPQGVEDARWVSEERARRLVPFFWILAIALGALQAWTYRNTINPDGVAYLDLADAYLQRDWHAAISAYWSPLYPVLVAVAMGVVRPGAQWEFPTLHAVNFVVFLVTFAAFGFFINGLLRYRQRQVSRLDDNTQPALPDWALLTAGYMLCTWTCIEWISLRASHPDMCVAAVVYLATGIILRAGARRTGAWGLAYGAVLGVGYLAKGVMLPLGLVFILSGALVFAGRKKGTRLAVAALAGFLAVGLPFIAALSVVRQRPTAGDAGPLNYAWFVNAATMFAHWEGDSRHVAQHPPQRLLDDPPVYRFAEPVGGTFPLWFDPSYWHEGLRPELDVAQQLKRLVYSTNAYLRIVLNASGNLGRNGNWMFGFFALLLLGGATRLRARVLWDYQSLALPALAAVGLYALVHVEPRFVAPFAVLLCLAGLAALGRSPRMSVGFVKGVIAATGLIWLSGILSLGHQMVSDLVSGQPQDAQWEVARTLGNLGIRQHERVAVLGNSFEAYWARLARVRIVADVPQWYVDQFWNASRNTRAKVINALQTTSAKVVVADRAPGWATQEDWVRLGATPYYAHVLPSRGTSDSRRGDQTPGSGTVDYP